MKQPLIGIVPLLDAARESYWMLPGYMRGVEQAGGAPVMLPLTDDAEALRQLAYGRLAAELGGQRLLFAHGGTRLFLERTPDLYAAAVAENALYLAENDRHGIGRKRKAALRVKIFGGLYKPDAARLKKVVVLRALASEFVGAGVDETDILFNELIAFSSVHRRVLL